MMLAMRGGDYLNSGEWLREKRTANRFSMRELASRTGYTAGYIHKLESNLQTQPDKEIVKKLASALGCSTEEALLAFGYHPEETVKEDAEFMRVRNILKGLPPDRRKRAIDALELLVS